MESNRNNQTAGAAWLFICPSLVGASMETLKLNPRREPNGTGAFFGRAEKGGSHVQAV